MTAGVPVLAGAAIGSYLLGSISPAGFVGRRMGIDLRGRGSGNLGAANVGRVLGRRLGVVVAVVDAAKGALPAALFGLAGLTAGLLAGFCAVLGHVSSPWLRGRGGKGVATAAGAILGSHPLWAPIVLAIWLLVLAVSRWIALSSVCAALSVVVVALVTRSAWPSVLWACALALVVVVRHRSNLVARLAERRGG
ncbi:MAG: glycerol-3-phosphate acyltransferase [Actinomycetota bacterium]|nr:glycerol-3-phosphate acyltransferase [Actinomycetota bacterium]